MAWLGRETGESFALGFASGKRCETGQSWVGSRDNEIGRQVGLQSN